MPCQDRMSQARKQIINCIVFIESAALRSIVVLYAGTFNMPT